MSVQGLAGPAVLVVDDEVGMRDTLTDIFMDAGYQVSSAGDGYEALDRLREGHFDVVIMDMRMPGKDGVTTLEEMGPPRPPVIMITAYAVDELLRRAVASKAYAVIHKPFGVPHLLRVVETALKAAPGDGPGQ